MIGRIIGRRVGRSLAKRAVRSAAQKRALKKAVLASARARAKRVGRAALAGPRAYGRSVVKRGARRQAKALEKIKTSYTRNRESISKLTKQLPDAQKRRDISKGAIGKLRDTIEETDAEYALTKSKFIVLGRKTKLEALADSKAISKSHLAKAIKAHRSASGKVDQIVGSRASALNEADRLASLYAKTLKQQGLFQAGTVLRDVTTVSIIGGAAAGVYKQRQADKKKREEK